MYRFKLISTASSALLSTLFEDMVTLGTRFDGVNQLPSDKRAIIEWGYWL